MFWVHVVQSAYLVVPGVSALVLLSLTSVLAWEMYRAQLNYFSWVGWGTIVIFLTLGIANLWVFYQVYGVMADRAVLG